MSNFSTPIIIGQGTNSDIDTAEETIVEITTLPELTKTQITMYCDTLLGTNTSFEYRIYYRHQKDGDWYARPKQHETDNTMDDFPSIIDSSTPNAVSSHYYTVYEFELAACYGLKITGKGAGGANSTSTVKVLARDN